MNEALQKAQEKMREMRENGEVIQILNPWEKWQSAEKSTRKLAIDAFCFQCMGGHDDPTGVRGMVKDCTCGPESTLPCPLFDWRPYK